LLNLVCSNLSYSQIVSFQKHEMEDSVFKKFKNDINNLDTKAVKTTLNVLSPVPTFRRVNSLPDELESNNKSRAFGLATLAAANIPGDMRELGLAIREGKDRLAGNPFVYRGQHSSAFLKNTFLKESQLNKLFQKAPWLEKLDKSLSETKSGKFLAKTLGVKVAPLSEGGMGAIDGLASDKSYIRTFKFTGNSFQKVAGRTLLRIPVLGLVLSSLFEVPALIKSTQTEGSVKNKAKSFAKQLGKSVSHIALVNGSIAVAGALLFPHGYIAALGAMAIGSFIGLAASKKLSQKIDNIT